PHHSFPTRRSSDLGTAAFLVLALPGKSAAGSLRVRGNADPASPAGTAAAPMISGDTLTQPAFLPLYWTACYLLGAVPFGFLAGRVFAGIDIRAVGSGNIGATNVLRTLGPLPAVLVLVLDAA